MCVITVQVFGIDTLYFLLQPEMRVFFQGR